jgi:hypothetical protein
MLFLLYQFLREELPVSTDEGPDPPPSSLMAVRLMIEAAESLELAGVEAAIGAGAGTEAGTGTGVGRIVEVGAAEVVVVVVAAVEVAVICVDLRGAGAGAGALVAGVATGAKVGGGGGGIIKCFLSGFVADAGDVADDASVDAVSSVGTPAELKIEQ